MTAKHLPAGDWRLTVYGGTRISGQDRRKKPRVVDRARTLEIQGNKCLYCEIPIGTKVWRGAREIHLRANWDHFVPYSYLAANPAANWVLACHVCNGIKVARMFDTVQAAREVILPRRLAKGYEAPEDVLFRLGHPETGGDVWPEELRHRSGSFVHYARELRTGIHLTACGREFESTELRHPQMTNRHCPTCMKRKPTEPVSAPSGRLLDRLEAQR